MTMRERVAAGMLFTDMCEGLPEERMKGKKFQKAFNDSDPEDVDKRIEMWKEMFAQGAGSVVVHDIPANTIAVGNPARVPREFNEHDMQYYYKNRPVDEKDLEQIEFIAKGETV